MLSRYFLRVAATLLIGGFASRVACADTETLWVKGVTQDGGWYDVNKTFSGDTNLCWAASASNLIAWWQQGYTVRAGIPNTKDDIWEIFTSKVTKDTGGDTHAAIQWWLSGVYVPTTKEEQERSLFAQDTESVLPAFDGYYTNKNGYLCSKYGFSITDGQGKEVSSIPGIYHFMCFDEYTPEEIDGKKYITRAFEGDMLLRLIGEGCGFGLGISFGGRDIGHAITLWGVEHEEGVIKALWITDSDDKKKALCRVETYTTDGGLLHLSTTGDYAYSSKSSEITVDTLFAIKPAVANAWLVENYGPVPEPATAMLILPGLVALAARRRRC